VVREEVVEDEEPVLRKNRLFTPLGSISLSLLSRKKKKKDQGLEGNECGESRLSLFGRGVRRGENCGA
jgi:hypothetical protein